MSISDVGDVDANALSDREGGQMKKLTASKIFWTGVAMVISSVIPAIVSGADWRSIVGASLGALVIALRPLTEKGINGL